MESSEQYEAPPTYSMASLPAANDRHASLMQIRMESNSELRRIEGQLRGAMYDKETKKWVPVAGFKPLANENGINKIMSILRLHTNKIFRLTNLEEHNINRMFFDTADSISQLLAFYSNEYGISRADRDWISTSLFNYMDALLRIPLDDMERIHMDNVTSHRETHVINESQRVANNQQGLKLFGNKGAA